MNSISIDCIHQHLGISSNEIAVTPGSIFHVLDDNSLLCSNLSINVTKFDEQNLQAGVTKVYIWITSKIKKSFGNV